ncbi:MAG: hypothetical protein AAF990_18540 [Bacteroidota bacterium]
MMLIYLLEVSACTLIFYTAFHFLYKDGDRHSFQRFFLLSALGISFLIPLLQIPVFPQYIYTNPTVALSAKKAIVTPPNTFDWIQALALLYLIGAALKFALLSWQMSKILRLIQSGRKEATKAFTKVYLEKGLPLSSFLHYLIVPTTRAKNLTTFELEHEKTHIQQKHSWDILFLEFVQVLLWFNPILLLYRRRLVEIHEYLADARTARLLGEEPYSTFLIQQISQQQPSRFIHPFHSLFKKRFDMMHSKIKTRKWQYALLVPMIAFALLLFSFQSYPVYLQAIDGENIPQDSLPPRIVGDENIVIDTVIIFDPATGQETIQVVKTRVDLNEPAVANTLSESTEDEIDTIIIFDSQTFQETMIIVKDGVADTIR